MAEERWREYEEKEAAAREPRLATSEARLRREKAEAPLVAMANGLNGPVPVVLGSQRGQGEEQEAPVRSRPVVCQARRDQARPGPG